MPTPLEFMERVLPWPGPEGSGWGNLHWSLTKPGEKGKRWRGAPYKTAEALINQAQKLAMAPADKAEDIYFCTSIQSMTDTVTMPDGRQFAVASRHADTATSIKALFLDVDIKTPPKGYTSLKEALDAINQFCKDAKLPGPSALVLSGGGVHVYWISGVPLTIAQWRPFAEGLKAEAMRLGLRADYGVTADPARILRVPGTFNRKIVSTPRPVKVLGLGCDYDFATDLAGLATIGGPLVTATVTKAAPFDLSAFQGKTMHPLLAAALANATDKLSDGIKLYSDLPLDPTNVFKECPHFRDSFVRAGQGQGQGLWMLTVLASTWWENGRDFAHAMSKGYPTYDKDETDAMFDRKLTERAKGLGWPSCKSFENEGCKLCKTCKYQPLAKSPLNLAERVQPPEPEPTNQIVTNPVTQVVMTAADLHLPDGYVLWNGHIAKKINLEEDPKAPPKYDFIPVFDGEVICEPRTSNTKPPNLYFKYKHGDNYSDVNIPYTAYASDQTLATAFLEAGIAVNPDADKFVRRFMRSWVSRIDLAYKRMVTAPLGWVYENGQRIGFAYGGSLFHCDGTVEDSAYSESDFIRNVTPSGTDQAMYECLEMLSVEHHPALEIIALQPWASPLLDVTGHKSTSILWSFSASGGRKSSAMRTGTALWYAPNKVANRGGVTETAMENKMDLLRNLPAVIDELTETPEIEKVFSLFNRIHEGGQGDRADNKGGLRKTKSWQLNLTCASNQSIYEFFDKKKVETDARALRMFELYVDYREPSRNKIEAQMLLGKLEYNYGHLGLKYAKYLAENVAKLGQWYEKLANELSIELAPPNEKEVPGRERYWIASVALTLMSAEIANQITGKPFFHYDEIKQCLFAAYRRNRAWVVNHVNVAVVGSPENTMEVWAQVLAAWINNQLATDTMHTGGKGRSNASAVRIISQPPRSGDRGIPVNVHWLQNPPMLRVAHTALIEQLGLMEKGAAVMSDRFEKLFGGTKSRKTFLAGIPIDQAKTKIMVWEIPITDGHPLYDAWASKVQAAQPANAVSAAAEAQDTGLVGAIQAQGAKDLATVSAST
jgi:hypothetical protein